MAKTLCRVAGGGKPLKGNAEAGDVLAGKTFSNKQSNALTGTMPNRGLHQSSTGVGGGSGSLYAYMPYGYYDNYNNSGNAWINITNDQAKTLANNAGVGYNKGVSDGKSVNAIGGCLAMAWWNAAISNSNPSQHLGWVDDTTQTLPPGTYVWAVGQKSNYATNDGCWIEVNGKRIAYVNNSDNNDSQQCGSYTLTSSANVRCRAGNYNGWGFAAFVRIG